MNKRSGFTIVELLVVIVVIGVLAAITIVSYSGISSKAIVSSIQADLSGNAKMLKLYYVEYGSYPIGDFATAFNGSMCPTANPTSKYCLKLSGSNSVDYYNGTSSGFTLRIKNGTTVYVITDNTASGQVTALTGIGDIAGSTHIGSTLTAGTLSPAGATATYQWQSATTSNGTYSNISGATSSTYTIMSSDINNYIKVVATGSGASYGTMTSNPTTQVDGWIVGRASSVLAGKYVYYQNLGSTYTWGPAGSLCPTGAAGSQPCQTGVDPYGTSSLINPQTYPGMSFASYPAQNACKSIGGRLPYTNEAQELYNSASYGNNFPQGTFYWTLAEYNSASAMMINHYWQLLINNPKGTSATVRCVKD